MPSISLSRANRIIANTFACAGEKGFKPLAVVNLGGGDYLKAFQAQDSISNNRFEIARGKAKGALAVGTGSRWLSMQAESRLNFLAGLSSVIDGGVVPVPGAVIARDKPGRIVAAVGISGHTSDADEECAVAGIEALNLTAEIGG